MRDSRKQLAAPAPPQTLEYGQRSRLGWIGRHRKKLIFITLCIATAIPVCLNWQSLRARAQWLYWSHRAAAFQMPAAELNVVDPQRAAKLLAENPDYVAPPFPDRAAWHIPQAYRQLSAIDPRFDMLKAGDRRSIVFPVVFMGKLHRPDGTPRLVIIQHFGGVGNNLPDATPMLVLPTPGLLDTPPIGRFPVHYRVDESGVSSNVTQYPHPSGGSTQLRAASIDPAGRSHLVVPYEILGYSRGELTGPVGQGFIDAYLQNDDSVIFKLRVASVVGTWPREWRTSEIKIDGDPKRVATNQARPLHDFMQNLTSTVQSLLPKPSVGSAKSGTTHPSARPDASRNSSGR